ncbi:hypothetical protein JZ751_024105 [Albula glossodonta]|uniref:Uncharacterized protein n=1 Tax=Albula glossodonta TaxID=121402 RepID=A0A8T2NRV6_9TELE|nr:hypothetical protein JZ751_024105 [Albula glossodonta]
MRNNGVPVHTVNRGSLHLLLKGLPPDLRPSHHTRQHGPIQPAPGNSSPLYRQKEKNSYKPHPLKAHLLFVHWLGGGRSCS